MSLLSRFFVLCVLLIATLHASPIVWAQDQARLTCRVEPSPLALNGQATLVVEIANIQNLYGYEINMTYDTGRIRIEDADTEKAGINLQLVNSFISPDFVVVNSADNGQISLALTQLAPNTPKSGSGELVRTTVVGIGAGFANFAFGDLVFSDTNGRAIPVVKEECLVEIGEAGQPTPTFTATPVPTAVPTNTDVPTQAATSVPQQSQAATATPLPQAPTSTPTLAAAAPTQTPVTPGAPTATPPPAETATPSVVTITTPTPDPQAQFSQTDATPMPAAVVAPPQTSTPVGEGASAQSPASATPAVGQDGATPSAGEGATESEPEPENNTQEMSASGKEDQQIAMVESVRTATVAPTVAPTATPTPTPTPVVIERVAQAAPLAVGAVQQPAATTQPAAGSLLQGRGWFFFVLTLILVVAAWRLRRGSPNA